MADQHSAGQRAAGRALKNTGTRAVAELVGKLSTFLLFAVLAREVGQAGLGAFVFAFAFLGLGMAPIALGSDSYMLRQVARDRSQANRLFFNVIAMKLALAVPVLAALLGVLFALDYEGRVRETVLVLSVGLFLDLLVRSLHALFNAHERGDLLALSLVVQRVVTALLGVAALALGHGVVTVAALYSVGSALGFGAATLSLWRAIGMPSSNVDPHSWRDLAGKSFPFAMQDVFTAMLFRVDAVILSVMTTEAAVGVYGAAYRVLEATMFIGWAISGAFVAMYAYLGRDTDPTVGAVFGRSVKLALVLVVPVSVVLTTLAEPIVRFAFGAEFVDAADPLRLLGPVALGLCLVILCSSMISSRRSPTVMVRITAPMVVLNVVLNVLLIPPLEATGAALAMLITEILFVALAMRIAVMDVGGIRWRSIISPLLAGGAMAVPALLLAGSPVVAFGTALVVYGAALALLESLIDPTDLQFALRTLRRARHSRAPELTG